MKRWLRIVDLATVRRGEVYLSLSEWCAVVAYQCVDQSSTAEGIARSGSCCAGIEVVVELFACFLTFT